VSTTPTAAATASTGHLANSGTVPALSRSATTVVMAVPPCPGPTAHGRNAMNAGVRGNQSIDGPLINR
jgi:hypothetical protein